MTLPLNGYVFDHLSMIMVYIIALTSLGQKKAIRNRCTTICRSWYPGSFAGPKKALWPSTKLCCDLLYGPAAISRSKEIVSPPFWISRVDFTTGHKKSTMASTHLSFDLERSSRSEISDYSLQIVFFWPTQLPGQKKDALGQ